VAFAGDLPDPGLEHRRRRAAPSGLYITFTGNPRQFQFQDQRRYYYIALASCCWPPASSR
jgi:hypothetical protein